ncbi:MAG: hypothetical protein ACTHKG_16460 [Nocardioides sp.]
MTTYVDPATALRLAHEARATDLRRSTQRRQARALTRRTGLRRRPQTG